MIDSLQGQLAAKSPSAVIIQNAGIGFRVRIPLSTYETLSREGSSVRLLTHLCLNMREEELTLYGFGTELERELFRMLIGVSRIGPAVALRVLSSCSVEQFKRHVMDEDAHALAAVVKGIGPKTARRLIAELRESVEALAVAATEGPPAQASRDAVQALIALGESRSDAEKAVRDARKKLGADADRQELVEEALSH